MRQTILLLFMCATAIHLASCNSDGSANLSADDSLKIYNSLAAHMSKQVSDTVPFGPQGKTFLFKKKVDDDPIPERDARTFHKDYLDNPIPSLTTFGYDNTTRVLLRGWSIKDTDLRKINTTGIKGARIYMGYDKARDRYCLILVGIGNDLANDLSILVDDFLPCPVYCPSDLAVPETSARIKIYKNDLNWERTEGNEEVFKDFNGGLYRRRNN